MAQWLNMVFFPFLIYSLSLFISFSNLHLHCNIRELVHLRGVTLLRMNSVCIFMFWPFFVIFIAFKKGQYVQNVKPLWYQLMFHLFD